MCTHTSSTDRYSVSYEGTGVLWSDLTLDVLSWIASIAALRDVQASSSNPSGGRGGAFVSLMVSLRTGAAPFGTREPVPSPPRGAMAASGLVARRRNRRVRRGDRARGRRDLPRRRRSLRCGARRERDLRLNSTRRLACQPRSAALPAVEKIRPEIRQVRDERNVRQGNDTSHARTRSRAHPAHAAGAMSRPASAAPRRPAEEANVKVVVRCRCVRLGLLAVPRIPSSHARHRETSTTGTSETDPPPSFRPADR